MQLREIVLFTSVWGDGGGALLAIAGDRLAEDATSLLDQGRGDFTITALGSCASDSRTGASRAADLWSLLKLMREESTLVPSTDGDFDFEATALPGFATAPTVLGCASVP